MSKKTATAATPSDKINLKQITSSFNHRNPLNDAFRKDGYGVFAEDVPVIEGQEPKTPLWTLGTSNDLAEKAQFCALIEKYENPMTPGVTNSIIALAQNILSVGQLQSISVRDNGGGKDKEERTFQLVIGHRRSLAILYLWCKGLTKAPEPRAKATFVKGNHQELQAMSISENIHRKPLTLIEQATAYKQAVNTGEEISEIATREGVSVATIKNRISLLQLSPANQERVANGKIAFVKAVQMVKNIGRGRGETTDDGQDGEGETVRAANSTKRNMLPRKTVEELWANEENEHAKRAYALVLREIELPTPAAPEEDTSEEAVELNEKGELKTTTKSKKGKGGKSGKSGK